MKEQLYALLHLQKVDNEITGEMCKRKALPVSIQEKERQINNSDKKFQIEKNNLKELQLKLRKKEMDVKAINEKIEKSKNELYGGKISDIKELKQLQKVIESFQEDRDIAEEGLLILMEEEDSLRTKIAKVEKEITSLNEQLKEIKKRVEQEDLVIQQNIEKKESEKKEIIEQINDESLISRYYMLWNDKKGTAIVEVDSSICSGCNLSLPSDIIYHLQRDDCLIICPNCNRMMVWKNAS